MHQLESAKQSQCELVTQHKHNFSFSKREVEKHLKTVELMQF